MSKDSLPPLPKIDLGHYRHYKSRDSVFEVIGIARHSETLEPLVVYRHLDDTQELWVRPYAMFTGTVVCDGQTRPRFEKIP